MMALHTSRTLGSLSTVLLIAITCLPLPSSAESQPLKLVRIVCSLLSKNVAARVNLAIDEIDFQVAAFSQRGLRGEVTLTQEGDAVKVLFNIKYLLSRVLLN